MKKLILLTIIGFYTITNYSQNEGISYQAVIYNPNAEQIPGYNNEMSPLANSDICLRFSIFGNGTEYQEVIQTSTDEFGMVNVRIGVNQQTGGYADGFNLINWNDGNDKALSVELDADGYCEGFEEISYQSFSYIPFAYYAQEADTQEIENLIAENQIASEQSDEGLQAAIDANSAADLEESEAGAAADASIIESFNSAIEIAQEPIAANAEAIAANAEAIAANTEADLTESEASAAADLALQEALENASAEATEAITNNAIAVAANAEAIAANTEADLAESEAGAAADLAIQEALENASAEATEAITNNAIAVAANAEAIAAEVERATTAETANAETIAAIISGTGLSNDGSYETNPNTNYINESVSLVNATENLDSAIAALQELVETLTERVVTLEQLHVPVITLLGEAQISFSMSSGDYTDAGATADDLDDGDLTEQIVIVNGVDVLLPDTYFVTYNVTDSDGNEAEEVIRYITVIDDIPPVITLTGDSEITLELGSEYIEAGASAIDNVDGDLTNDILITGSVDYNTAGTYTIFYDVSDSSGNAANTVSRTIIVNAASSNSGFTNDNVTDAINAVEVFGPSSENYLDFYKQSFIASESGSVQSVSVYAKMGIQGNSNIWLTVTSDMSCTNIEDAIFMGGFSDISLNLGTEFEWVTIPLNQPFDVIAGQSYAFTINGPTFCQPDGTTLALNAEYEDGSVCTGGEMFGCSTGNLNQDDLDIIFTINLD